MTMFLICGGKTNVKVKLGDGGRDERTRMQRR